jgi:hypothetical protein
MAQDIFDLDNLEAVTGVNTTDTELATTAGNTMADLHDKTKKLLFAIDCSGSMYGEMYSDDQLRRADWTPGEEKIDRKIARATAFILAASQGNVPPPPAPKIDRWGNEEPVTEPEFDDESALYWASLQPLDFPSRVERIIAEAAYMDVDGLINTYSWDNDEVVSIKGETRDKMSIVKEEVLAQVAQRFAKYADADVGAVAFDTSAKDLHAYSLASLQERIPTMDRGMGGGTNIAKAIFACLSMINKSPSATNNHHIVIVSDGLDNSVAGHADRIKREFEDKGVTMDFIHITGLDSDTYGRNEVVSLKEISDVTGGEYVAVRTTDQFRTKFIAAATRLALPAPKGQ